MSEVIVVTSGKGGVGKTTTTANLGVGLARLGKKVVLLDTDIGLRNLDVALGIENRVVYDLVDVVTGVCEIKKAIIKHKAVEGLHVIPAAQATDKDAVSVEQMKALCDELKQEYDFVLIDCPAGIEQGFKNAVAGADKALVVTVPVLSAVRDADRVVGLLEEMGIDQHYVIINKIRPELMRRGEMMTVDDVINLIDIDLIGIIPDAEDVLVSANKGETVVIDPKSTTGQCYRNIAQRLAGENVPLMEFGRKGLFKRFKKTKKV